MIPYETLVLTIEAWRSGARPAGLSAPPPHPGTPEAVEELESGVVDVDEEYAGEEYGGEEYGGQDADQGYADQGYADQGYAEPSGEQPVYDDEYQ